MKTTPSEYRVVVSNVGMVFRGLNRAKAMAEYEEAVMASKNFLSGRWHGEEVTLFEDDEILKEYDPGAAKGNPKAKPITDKERMDYLVMHIVDVRAELRYGSRLLFTSQARHENDGTDTFIGTMLRAQIDEAIMKERKKT